MSLMVSELGYAISMAANTSSEPAGSMEVVEDESSLSWEADDVVILALDSLSTCSAKVGPKTNRLIFKLTSYFSLNLNVFCFQ